MSEVTWFVDDGGWLHIFSGKHDINVLKRDFPREHLLITLREEQAVRQFSVMIFGIDDVILCDEAGHSALESVQIAKLQGLE